MDTVYHDVFTVKDNSLENAVVVTSRRTAGLYDVIAQPTSTSLPLSSLATRTPGLYDNTLCSV